MSDNKTISGFSKLSKRGKIKWIVENFFKDPETVMNELVSYWHPREDQQKVLDGFSENTISNFPMPFGVAPNFRINDRIYLVPMVIEESSVVAAASAAAKYWFDRGGFKAEIIGMKKVGQVHFKWKGNLTKLENRFDQLKKQLLLNAKDITRNMEKRGGGIVDVKLVDLTDREPWLFQLKALFHTCDSMGANFINSVLESFAQTLDMFILSQPDFTAEEKDVRIIMSILSNYTPENRVKVSVSCPIEQLADGKTVSDPKLFAEKFYTAVRIAHIDPHRATTHNKGIYNGIDAVVLATGNDFRAIEACGHTYAARNGQYRSLSECTIDDGIFRFWIDLPLAVGTVGGLTNAHPIARRSLEMLGNPGAEELMMIIGAVGLAQNFSAVRSLVTTGIQKGHMKLHLTNILNQLEATEQEMEIITGYFEDKTVSYSGVREQLDLIRNKK
jgi:hydroxymethylglutaryl-CoA reductase